MVFINLEKIYDNVSWEVLWRYMEAKGVHVKYTMTIIDLFEGL